MCSDSAHKTLPVLTGGAYLHISKNAPEGIENEVRKALLLFGSTSPSYLILESLDNAISRTNSLVYIKCAKYLSSIKNKLSDLGIKLIGDEPLKLTFDLRNAVFSGNELSRYLRENGFECEYSDRVFVVTMWSPYMDYESAGKKLLSVIKDRAESARSDNPEPDISEIIKLSRLPEVRFQPYETFFLPHSIQPVSSDLIGSVAAEQLISCPPAVSPIIAGEVVNDEIIRILNYYDINHLNVLVP
jgi:arginine/lysine/ornithine decarboxylase